VLLLNECLLLFRYPLSPETFGYTLILSNWPRIFRNRRHVFIKEKELLNSEYELVTLKKEAAAPPGRSNVFRFSTRCNTDVSVRKMDRHENLKHHTYRCTSVDDSTLSVKTFGKLSLCLIITPGGRN
jgi:hypothetical protein